MRPLLLKVPLALNLQASEDRTWPQNKESLGKETQRETQCF